MDPDLIESLRKLKWFFDDVHRNIPSPDRQLLCLGLDHILCLFSGLKMFYDFENQPFDADNVKSQDLAKFFYELRCLRNYAATITHLKLVPGSRARINSKVWLDLGDLLGLRTVDIRLIPHSTIRGFDVLCRGLESVSCTKCQVPSIKAILSGLRRTKSKKALSMGGLEVNWDQLRVLKLMNNEIETLDEAISLAKNLEILDLSYNKISSCETSLECLPKLEGLFLNFNHVTSLSKFVSPSMVSLVQLSISYNLLQSLGGLEGLTNLRELDVSHNLIMFTDNLRQLKSLKRLEMLFVEGNPMCLEKGYREEVIKKLHPAVVDHVALDGRKLSRRDRKLFFKTFDTAENPVPVVGHHSPTGSIRAICGKKPRVVENIPDQMNFQDDEDFLISGSFYDDDPHHEEFIRHFHVAHENYRPDGLEDEQAVIHLRNPQPAGGGRGRGLPVEVEDKEAKVEGNVTKFAQEEISGEGATRNQVPRVQGSPGDSAADPVTSTSQAEPRMESSSEFPDSVQIKVKAVIEGLNLEGRLREEEGRVPDAEVESVDRPSGGLAGADNQEHEPLPQKDQGSILNTSEYFDARQFLDSPSTDRHTPLVTKSRSTVDSPDRQTGRDSIKGDGKSPTRSTSMGTSEKVKDESLSSLFSGMPPKERVMLLRDVTGDETSFDVSLSPPSSPDFDLSCLIRRHWLLVVRRGDLPRPSPVELFDLRAVVKVARVGDEVRLEFDTLKRSRRRRTFVVEGGEAPSEEFAALLRPFIKKESSQQKMLECLKCSHVFEDSSESPPLSQSGDFHPKTKKALAELEKQVCPRCSSSMVVQAIRREVEVDQSEQAIGAGGSGVLSRLSRHLGMTDFGQIEKMLNRSLSSEMGVVPPANPDLTSSGTFQVRRKFIRRGIIGGDEEVDSYVDEEGQEAI